MSPEFREMEREPAPERCCVCGVRLRDDNSGGGIVCDDDPICVGCDEEMMNPEPDDPDNIADSDWGNR